MNASHSALRAPLALMALNLSADCTFTGPTLPEPFVKFNLEAELNRLALLPKTTAAEGRALDKHRKFVRRKLGALVSHRGALRVQNHVIEPLLVQLGYSLTLDQSAHVLSTSSHSRYKDAPRQCLEAFDELHQLGLEAFTKKHDLYWNTPLNEKLPQPMIDLPIPEVATDATPAKAHKELFDFQTAPCCGELFTQELVVRIRRAWNQVRARKNQKAETH